VFTKVKPKQLNGKMLTGQMFAELCISYCDSINKGSVPSIEGAWTSLCKNENLRNIQEAIKSYEKIMDGKIYVDEKKIKCIDYTQLKKLHKSTISSVLDEFKTKAFGDIHAESIQKIENDILEKYKYIKQKIYKQYDNQINAILKPLSELIESKIRMNQFKKP